ncbi:fibronectin type III domain-containing protein [Pyxidicoccus sp. 3LFB2]
MKSRRGLYVLGLLVLVGALACGGDSGPPPPPEVRLPGAPTSVSATPGDGQATVSWTPPTDNGGSPITGYTVQALAQGAQPKSVQSGAASVTVTGLTNGTAYTFVVAATNAKGDGAASAPSAAVTPRTVPGAPFDLSATPGNRQVEVSWKAPTDAGMPITRYVVEVRQGETVVKSQEVTGLSATLTGLTNGTTYSFTVTAANTVIAGPASAAIVATPRTVPGAPGISAMAGLNKVVVVTLTVTDDGGSPVTGFTIHMTSRAGIARTVTSTTPEVEISGLENGVTFDFTATASNIVGEGPASASVSAKPYTWPSAPRDLQATASEGVTPGYIDCSWRPPQHDNGDAVTGYRISLFQESPNIFLRSFETTEPSARVTGLTPGTGYILDIQAKNGAGYGDSLASHVLRPFATPDAVESFTATPALASVQLAWTPPAFDGGFPIGGYVVVVVPTGDTFEFSAAERSAIIGDLLNGFSYTFTIHARNNIGVGTGKSVTATPTAE